MSRRNPLNPDERTIMSEYRNGREYQSWLTRMVQMHDHKKLFTILYETEFLWVHPFDENRADEGIALRYRFTQDFLPGNRNRRGYHSDMEDIPCSVLEMLIGLALSMEDSIMYDPSKGNRTPVWFWMMLENLDLARYSDRYLSSLTRREYTAAMVTIKSTLYMFMERRYDRNGHGGLFPIEKSRVDQRDEELWYQANMYAIEVLGL